MSPHEQTLAVVRRAVRSVVENTPELRAHPQLERTVAERMVGVSLAAAELIAEEARLSDEIARRSRRVGSDPPLAQAQAAGDIHRRTAVNAAAGVLRGTRDAIDFPGFVTSLITSVFQSIQTSSIQQLQAFSDLLESVNSSTDDFATSQISQARAAQWAVGKFAAFALEGSGEAVRLTLRDGADMPDTETLKRALDASDDEVATVDEGELTETLLPLVRRKLARDRQAMLSTMVLMGLQRVVVDDGALHASMRLQVDARSTAEQTSAEQLDTRVSTQAGANFGVGAWGASARMSATVGYVKSDEQFTREDIGVSAGLRSSVDLRFRTLPLDVTRMAGDRTLQQIQNRSLVPQREQQLGSLIATATPRATRSPSLPAPAAGGGGTGQTSTARGGSTGSRTSTGNQGSGTGTRTTTGTQRSGTGTRTTTGTQRSGTGTRTTTGTQGSSTGTRTTTGTQGSGTGARTTTGTQTSGTGTRPASGAPAA